MNYVTVFNIADAGYKSWSFPAFGLIFIVIGILLVLFGERPNSNGGLVPRTGKKFAYFFLIFAVIWTVIAFISTYRQYYTLINVMKEGRYRVVEGVVTHFVPMPYQGHSDERFCVKSVCFRYSDYEETAGFNNTASHGGPIKPGLHVRVFYIGNDIIRLDVAKSVIQPVTTVKVNVAGLYGQIVRYINMHQQSVFFSYFFVFALFLGTALYLWKSEVLPTLKMYGHDGKYYRYPSMQKIQLKEYIALCKKHNLTERYWRYLLFFRYFGYILVAGWVWLTFLPGHP